MIKAVYTLSVLIILIFSHAAFCQVADSATKTTPTKTRVYHVNYLTGSIILAGGLATDALAISKIKDKAKITDAELLALNTESINPIDRWALHQDPIKRKTYSKISDYAEPPIFILLPALLALDKKIRPEFFKILFMYFEGHTITFTFYNYSWLGPMFQNRYRPLTYYTNIPLADRVDGGNRNSFYSGHVASVAFTTFFITKVYCDYHPDIGAAKYLLYSAALIPPLAMGYLRVKSLAHFPSDDMVGLTLGAVIGIALPELHKFNYKGITLGMSCTPEAVGMSLCWKLPVHKFSE